MLGKTNMDEFAMGSANESSYFGPVRNPWHLEHVPGGSSGGSAAAVAAGLAPFATGSDTGGSIRQPAAFCGITGLKPTYGRISRYGMVAFASSLDQAGPMAHRAEDVALILKTMSGYDEKDSTSLDEPVPDYDATLSSPLKKMRIGLPKFLLELPIHPDVRQAAFNALKIFEQAGAQIVELDLSLQPFWTPCYYVLACAEASSNLSRFDGIRFGHRAQGPMDLMDLISRTREEGFGTEVKRRILTGTYVLSTGHFDTHYVQAQKIRRKIQEELLTCFFQVDVILSPTTPTCAFQLGERITDPTQRYLADTFTVGANLAGLPALSMPVGFSAGLPIGLQLMGRPLEESSLLRMAHFYQQRTSWHQKRPKDFQ
jgi:aspartyl-tRNA(Asn)/glutamyl-tRNA(Gln) amidotransferase subunit A